MHRRARFVRFGWFVAALFQLLLPTFVSVADSRAEAASIGAASRPHVEAEGTRGCPRVHPDDCAICRVLAAGARTARQVALAIAPLRVVFVAALRDTRSVGGAVLP